MSLIAKTSILDQGINAAAQAAHHLATTLKTAWEEFWQRDSEVILEELHADVAKTAQVFQLNTEAGTSVNALLDSIQDDRFSNRAPTAMPEGWSFDGSAFAYTKPIIEIPVEQGPDH